MVLVSAIDNILGDGHPRREAKNTQKIGIKRMDWALTVSRKYSRWLSIAMLIAMSFVLLACRSSAPDADGLLLAFESKPSGSVSRIHVMQSIVDREATWSAATPWVNTAYPESDVPTGGVGIASNSNLGRLVGWNTTASNAFSRSGVSATWAATARKRSDEANSPTRSAPSIARHGDSSWLIAERVQQQSRLLVYWPEQARSQEQTLGDAAFSSFSRSHPVIATSKDRFLLADALLGDDVNAKLQIVTGNVTRSGVANAKRFTPVYCVPPQCPVVMPLVTADWVNEEDEVMQFIATDVALADDLHGGFLLAALEARAKSEPAMAQLSPHDDAAITLKVLRSSNESFNRGDGYSVWSSVTTHMGLRADTARFVQVAPMPGSVGGILVLTVGPAGKAGWKMADDGTNVQALTVAEVNAMFGGAEPASQPFALIRTSRSAN
jgi:hypothetical protein